MSKVLLILFNCEDQDDLGETGHVTGRGPSGKESKTQGGSGGKGTHNLWGGIWPITRGVVCWAEGESVLSKRTLNPATCCLFLAVMSRQVDTLVAVLVAPEVAW